MSSIRLRFSFLLLIFAGTTLAMSYIAYDTFRAMQDSRRQLEMSYQMTSELQDLDKLKVTPEFQRRWQSYRARLTPPRRMEELSNLIQSLNEGTPRPLRERHQVFLRNEAEFQRFTREQHNYLEQKLVYYGSLAIFVMVFGFLSLLFFVQRSILRPMRDLSRKMNDFLHDRYTYQFGVPSNDEIGRMQATFNSLAQRVISNMEQLKTLDSAKSEFLSIASHELRTPLTSIKGSISLMRTGVVGKMNEMAENLLTIAENESDRLIRLINDILDLAKIEARKLPLHQDWASFNELVKTSLQSLQGLAQQADVTLVAEELPPLEAYMDADRVQQVLTNLLSNAVKFSPKDSTVIVRAEILENHQIRVEVRDHGRGIAPEDQEAIFQKFRQATNSRNPLVKGTGLGLAIAKALVEQHGGEISVHSTPGEGSSFFFTLPEWRYSTLKRPEATAA